MNIEELTPHIEELKRVLEGKVAEDQIISELNTYLNVYHVSLDAAKRGIIRKYGGEIGFVTAETISKKIGELTGTEQSVDITGRVAFAEKKDIQVRGAPKTIISGIIGDETATASFTIWDVDDIQVEKGLVYIFKNAYTKMWNDRVQINLGSRGAVERSDADITLPERTITYTSSEQKIGDLREGIGNVTVTGRILSVEKRDIQSQGETKTVFSGMIADETGKIQFSAWSDFELKDGESVRIENAYIRSWRGIPQLNMGDRAEVSRVDDTFGDAAVGESSTRSIGDMIKIGGGIDITVEGTVIDLRTGSGLIKRCPECNRSVLADECVSHGKITSVPDIRMKLVIDDGSGAINTIVNRDDTERLTGMTLDDAIALAKEQTDPEAVSRAIEQRILMREVKVTGNIMSDDYGPMMIVHSIDNVEKDVVSEAEALLKEVEASL